VQAVTSKSWSHPRKKREKLHRGEVCENEYKLYKNEYDVWRVSQWKLPPVGAPSRSASDIVVSLFVSKQIKKETRYPSSKG
jgi:hypothetical protein